MGTSGGLQHCGEDLAEQLVNRTHQRRLFTAEPAHEDWRAPAWLVEEPVADIAGDQQLVVAGGVRFGMIAGMNFLGRLLVKLAGGPLADAKTGEDSGLLR
jgi:hypothetical protein